MADPDLPEHIPSPEQDDQAPRPRLSRRSFLGLCSLFGLGTGAWYVGQKGLSFDLADQLAKLDSWWQSRHHPAPSAPRHHPVPNTAEVREYEAFLAAHPLRYLSPREITRPHFKKRSGVVCGLPPRELWPELLPALRVADELRHRLGVPLRIVISAYRSPQYNAKCPGASTYSQHLHNRALDLAFDCDPDEAFAMADALRREGFFTGGLGRYESFIHIDTRGRNATWGV